MSIRRVAPGCSFEPAHRMGPLYVAIDSPLKRFDVSPVPSLYCSQLPLRAAAKGRCARSGQGRLVMLGWRSLSRPQTVSWRSVSFGVGNPHHKWFPCAGHSEASALLQTIESIYQAYRWCLVPHQQGQRALVISKNSAMRCSSRLRPRTVRPARYTLRNI
jgi:hypothetical protein